MLISIDIKDLSVGWAIKMRKNRFYYISIIISIFSQYILYCLMEGLIHRNWFESALFRSCVSLFMGYGFTYECFLPTWMPLICGVAFPSPLLSSFHFQPIFVRTCKRGAWMKFHYKLSITQYAYVTTRVWKVNSFFLEKSPFA